VRTHFLRGESLEFHAIQLARLLLEAAATMHAVLTLTCSFVTLAMILGAAVSPKR
jgi:hypothetical protein